MARCASSPTTNKKLLLDHVLLSPGLLGTGGLRRVPGSGAIHHAGYEAEVSGGGGPRDKRPSDHRPVSVQLRYRRGGRPCSTALRSSAAPRYTPCTNLL
jgi:hypothetical protein